MDTRNISLYVEVLLTSVFSFMLAKQELAAKIILKYSLVIKTK